jgi:hypothetical protein
MDDRFCDAANAVTADIVLDVNASSWNTSSVGGSDEQWTIIFISSECFSDSEIDCKHWIASRRKNGAIHEGFCSGDDIWDIMVRKVKDKVDESMYNHLSKKDRGEATLARDCHIDDYVCSDLNCNGLANCTRNVLLVKD